MLCFILYVGCLLRSEEHRLTGVQTVLFRSTKGYLVIFDEQLDSNPLLVQNRDVFELTVDGKTLRIYLIGVTV